MDRNYFLSYGQIAFLLLLSAVGKLNARFISATASKFELLHCADVNDTDLYLHVANAFSRELPGATAVPGAVDCRSCHHDGTNDGSQRHIISHDEALRKDAPVANDKKFYLFLMNDLIFTPVWNKWSQLESAWSEGTVMAFENVNQFFMNSSKLIDGFKFIIKIPDKLTLASMR